MGPTGLPFQLNLTKLNMAINCDKKDGTEYNATLRNLDGSISCKSLMDCIVDRIASKYSYEEAVKHWNDDDLSTNCLNIILGVKGKWTDMAKALAIPILFNGDINISRDCVDCIVKGLEANYDPIFDMSQIVTVENKNKFKSGCKVCNPSDFSKYLNYVDSFPYDQNNPNYYKGYVHNKDVLACTLSSGSKCPPTDCIEIKDDSCFIPFDTSCNGKNKTQSGFVPLNGAGITGYFSNIDSIANDNFCSQKDGQWFLK
jgi:hypothetical protein